MDKIVRLLTVCAFIKRCGFIRIGRSVKIGTVNGKYPYIIYVVSVSGFVKLKFYDLGIYVKQIVDLVFPIFVKILWLAAVRIDLVKLRSRGRSSKRRSLRQT